VGIVSRIRNREARLRLRVKRSLSMADVVPSPDEVASRPELRIVIIGVIVAVLFAVMILRLFSLQVVHAATAKANANGNALRVVTLPAPRGLITDRENHVMVGNAVTQNVVLSREFAIQNPTVVGKLAALIGESPKQIWKQLYSNQYLPYQPVPVVQGANLSVIQYLEEHAGDFAGVSVETTTQRIYPLGGTSAAQLLGYVGSISAAELAAHANDGYTAASKYGQAGIENFYQQQLRGVAGLEEVAVNSHGQDLGVVKYVAPRTGDTVVLNIDAGLQADMTAVLTHQIMVDRQTKDSRSGIYPKAIDGSAVVLDPNNGSVLGMVSFPTFDLNGFVNGLTQAQLNTILQAGALNNYAIGGLYTPGSTFKMITSTAALQHHIINPYQAINDTGAFTVPICQKGGAGCIFHDDDNLALGYVDMPTALTQSSDYYFYNLGYLFGISPSTYGSTPIQDTAASYGLDALTGIDLPGEVAGRVDSPSVRLVLHRQAPKAFPNTTWYIGDNIEMAFGQGATAVTPIAMADAYATLVNGGTRYAPEVAAGLATPGGKLVMRYGSRVTGHVAFTPQMQAPIIQGLLGVVNNPKGTAYPSFQQYAKYNQASFVVGGKTGTATNVAGEEPNSWFVGFGPWPHPKYVVVCVIAQGGYGASAAAPVVAQIFNYLTAHPVKPVVYPSVINPPQVTTTTMKAATTTTSSTSSTLPQG
jgi:penicillin-binding protein 2